MDKEGLLLRRVVKGRSLSPKDYSTVQAIFKPCKTKRNNVMTCIPWLSLLDAVRWQFKSRVDPSRASKPWSSRVSFRFSQGNKDSKIFPLRYIRKTSCLEQGEEKKSRKEERRRRDRSRRRSSRSLEINSPIISLICLVLFSLIIHGFCPSHEWLVYC